MDDALRHGLEQRPVPLLRGGQVPGQHLQPVPVPDMRGGIGGVQQDPGDGFAGVAHRLAGELHEHLPCLRTALLNPDPGLDGFPGLHDSLDLIESPLAG